MAPHADTFDQPEPLKSSLLSSLALHAGIVALLVTYTVVGPSHHESWGDIHGGGMGAVAVSPVASIPLPQRSAAINPVANDTESHVPTPPPKPKVIPKAARTPPPDAIPLKSRDAKFKPEKVFSSPNKFREQQHYQPNQLYSTAGQEASSPMFSKPGAGGIGIGNNSPFGTQFGYYATIVQQRVAQNWNTSEIDPHLTNAPAATVTFTILRDGSVPQNSVKVAQSSGNLSLDLSAQRAVLSAAPFPPLPQGFSRSQADVQLRFELRR